MYSRSMRSCSILRFSFVYLFFVCFHGNIYKSILVLGRITAAVIHCAVVFKMFDRHLLLVLTSLFFGWYWVVFACAGLLRCYFILAFTSLCISSHFWSLILSRLCVCGPLDFCILKKYQLLSFFVIVCWHINCKFLIILFVLCLIGWK